MSYDPTKERPALDTSLLYKDMVAFLCEGNPGAINAMIALRSETGSLAKAMLTLIGMDEMNIRGPQIWVMYKYVCGGDVNKMYECVKARDPEAVAHINKEMGNSYPWIATTSGAAKDRMKYFKGDGTCQNTSLS